MSTIKKLSLPTLIIFLFFSSVGYLSNAQNVGLEWVKQIGGTKNDYAEGVTVDKKGNVYTTGYYQDKGYFNLPDSSITHTSDDAPSDIFVTKHDAAGNYVWSKSMGGKKADKAMSVAVDNDGNVYVTGSFMDKAEFNHVDKSSSLTSNGDEDVFVAKLDSTGAFLWVKQIGGNGTDRGEYIAVDEEGNVHIVGVFTGKVDFDPGSDSLFLQTLSAQNAFICKLSNEGELIWARNVSGTGTSEAYSVAVDKESNVYVTGVFSEVVEFKPGVNVNNLTSFNNITIFVTKLDSTGTFKWAQDVGGNGDDIALGIAIDDFGNSFIGGYFKEPISFPTGSGIPDLNPVGNNDILVAKLDLEGKVVWAKGLGGTGQDYGQEIATDAAGNVYVTGMFSATAYFDADTSVSKLVSRGNQDLFINKMDNNGKFVWVKQFGGNSLEQSKDIALDRSGNVYLTGYFRSSATNFEPNPPNSTALIAAGADAFVLKLSCVDTSSFNLITATCEDEYTLLDYSFTETGLYTIITPNSYGCDSIITLDITFNKIEPAIITVDGYILSTSSTYTTYQWFRDDNIIEGADSSTLHITENGSYTVAVSDINGCVDTSEAYNINNVNVGELNILAQQITIYPNPSSDIIHIKSPVSINISITSLEGRIISTHSNASQVSVQALSDGIYLMRITDKEGRLIKVEKFIKSK